MSNLEENYKAAKQKSEQQKRKRRMMARQNARREQAITNGRYFEVGRIVCERFPELRKYQPRYGDAVSDMIHDELVAVADFLAANRELLNQIRAEALGGDTSPPALGKHLISECAHLYIPLRGALQGSSEGTCKYFTGRKHNWQRTTIMSV